MYTFKSVLPLLALLVLNSVQTHALASPQGPRGLESLTTEVVVEDSHGNETSTEEHQGEDDLVHTDEHDEDEEHAENEDEDASSTSALAGEGESKPWGEIIVAALVINLITLIGVVFLSGEFVATHVFQKDVAKSPYYKVFSHNVIPSFACGALLATTVFLVLPESLYLISAHFVSSESEAADAHADHRFLQEEEEDGEGAAIWRFGTCIICGFLLPVLTAALFPQSHHPEAVEESAEAFPGKSVEETDVLKNDDELDETDIKTRDELDETEEAWVEAKPHSKSLERQADADLVVTTDTGALPLAIDWPLAVSIMAGDFFHNFADGIFVGTSFMNCDRDLAIAISAATIYHEIAQEVADYFMLTRFCNIPPVKALCLNFINGLSVLLGAVMIVAIEDMTDVAIGSILAVSSGVYFYISVAECFPRARQAHKTWRDKQISLLSFACGAVPIGLVLLNHGHCEAGHDH